MCDAQGGCGFGRCSLLKLKRVQILGFKSFCDRTEIQLSGDGIAAVVGPNGCGKSNIADAIMWVLGEQSAKSLRGAKMEDVIFAGTRERKATGMAEVSLTLVDPEVYDGAALGGDGSVGEGDWSSDGSSERALDLAGDWDEAELRQMRAAETEEATAEAQPGVVIGIDGNVVEGEDALALQPAHSDETAVNGAPGSAEGAAGNGVVLKPALRR